MVSRTFGNIISSTSLETQVCIRRLSRRGISSKLSRINISLVESRCLLNEYNRRCIQIRGLVTDKQKTSTQMEQEIFQTIAGRIDEEKSATEEPSQKHEIHKIRKPPRPRTYYEVLGVPMQAGENEIKTAYINKAKLLHPDVAQNGHTSTEEGEAETAQQFHQLLEAYSIIKVPWKRSLYNSQMNKTNEHANCNFEGMSHIWDNETDGEKVTRRERYRRYAQEERSDEPFSDAPSWIGQGLLICGMFGSIILVVMYFPGKLQSEQPDFGMEEDEAFNKAAKMVLAFYNPFENRWEEIPDGFGPPTVDALLQFYQNKVDDETFDRAVLPTNELTVIKVPKSKTKKPSLLSDISKGEIVEFQDIKYKFMPRTISRWYY